MPLKIDILQELRLPGRDETTRFRRGRSGLRRSALQHRLRVRLVRRPAGCEKYLDWYRQWGAEVVRVLKPDGTFWLAIGDEFAAELKVMFQRELRLTCRSWVMWYYTFGVNCKYKFSRSHAHLFHLVKDPKQFTFNVDAIRVPSARQLVYADMRANPAGRLPDDTWISGPQDLPDGF